MPVHGHKIAAGWITEKAARWRVLLAASSSDGLPDRHRLRVLLDRTGDQLAILEELRIQAGAGLFGPG